jgi:lactoylglutathione lyase
LERGPTPESLCQVMLRVGDLDRSINRNIHIGFAVH